MASTIPLSLQQIKLQIDLCHKLRCHKLRCPVNYNYWNLFNCSVCKDVKIFSKQSKNYTVFSKTWIKTNHVDKRFEFPLIYLCKTPGNVALVKDRYFIKVTSHSIICHCCYEQSYCNQ